MPCAAPVTIAELPSSRAIRSSLQSGDASAPTPCIGVPVKIDLDDYLQEAPSHRGGVHGATWAVAPRMELSSTPRGSPASDRGPGRVMFEMVVKSRLRQIVGRRCVVGHLCGQVLWPHKI